MASVAFFPTPLPLEYARPILNIASALPFSAALRYHFTASAWFFVTPWPMSPWGNIASVGLVGGTQLNTTVMPFILRGVSLLGISSSSCPTHWRSHLWKRLATDLAPQHLDKIVTRVASMEDLPEIFDAMLKGKTSGRTVIKVGE